LSAYPHTVMSTLGAKIARHTIVCTAPSKTFNLAGMAASNIMISDDKLRERFVTELQATGISRLTMLAYKACELAYNHGEAWLEELLQLVQHNHERVKAFMARRMPQVTVFDLEGTYLQWLDFRALGKSADESRTIHEQQACVFFDEGASFGEEGAGFERLNLAAPTAAIEQALERLAAAHGC